MKIFTAAQIRACDAYTVQAAGIRSFDLMERAAGKCVDWIKERFSEQMLFVVLCGTGNNGGDGLAITRLLVQSGYGAKAFLLNSSKELSPDCLENFQKLKDIDDDLVTVVEPDTFITDIPPHIIIIDAIFGTGLSRPVSGWMGVFIDQINLLPNRKIAIDIPSGLPADTLPEADASIMRVRDTLSFQFFKRSFLHPESVVFAGNIHVLNIGLDRTFIGGTHTLYKTLEHRDIKAIYRPRERFAHKGTYGSILMVGGSYGKMGAITLSARAALRAGAGLVTALIPRIGYPIIQTAAPEVMCLTSGESVLEKIEHWENKTVGIGPGMGTEVSTAGALAAFVEACKEPCVIDADGLNLLAKQPELLASLPKGTILTPHPKEFARLFGESANSMVQLEHARIQCMRYNINIVLKGHHTAIVTAEGDCWYNMNGNPGMATGGTGDVLTGIICGLLGQGYEPAQAAMLGVYLHGLAGDIAAKELSQEAMIAGDIIDFLGKAFLTLY